MRDATIALAKRILFLLLVLPAALVFIALMSVCILADLFTWIATGNNPEMEFGNWTENTVFLPFRLIEPKKTTKEVASS